MFRGLRCRSAAVEKMPIWYAGRCLNTARQPTLQEERGELRAKRSKRGRAQPVPSRLRTPCDWLCSPNRRESQARDLTPPTANQRPLVKVNQLPNTRNWKVSRVPTHKSLRPQIGPIVWTGGLDQYGYSLFRPGVVVVANGRVQRARTRRDGERTNRKHRRRRFRLSFPRRRFGVSDFWPTAVSLTRIFRSVSPHRAYGSIFFSSYPAGSKWKSRRSQNYIPYPPPNTLVEQVGSLCFCPFTLFCGAKTKQMETLCRFPFSIIRSLIAWKHVVTGHADCIPHLVFHYKQ